MADGTFAVLLLLLGWSDMKDSYCHMTEGCFARSTGPAHVSLSVGEVIHRRADPAMETYMRYDMPRRIGPFGQAVGLSVGEAGEIWAGYGVTYLRQIGPVYAQLHLMPGLYLDNGGFDLGGWLEFRSGLEIGIQMQSGWRIALAYDHRSNGGIFSKNPGIETAQIKIGFPDE